MRLLKEHGHEHAGPVRVVGPGQTARLKRFALPLSPAEAQARLAKNG